MRIRVVLMILAAAFLASANLLAVALRPMKKDPVKEDMKKLEGQWVIESYIQLGQDMSATWAGKMSRVITGNRWATTSGGQTTQYTFQIDPTKRPKAMDITTVGPGGEKQTFLCIYEVTGDTLTLCQAQGGQKRPTKFTAKAGNDILTVAKRRKKAEG
jgi:uncharacterized protein (TIGR03067 family)